VRPRGRRIDDTRRRSPCRGLGIPGLSVALELPPLTAEESAHAARLGERLRDEISRCGGWIDFSRYMQIALYEPGLGYYSAGARKLGEAGDFITAPEVAPVFSRCLAVQCAEVLRTLGGGDLLELGAGQPVVEKRLDVSESGLNLLLPSP